MSVEQNTHQTSVGKPASGFRWMLVMPFLGIIGYPAAYVTGLIFRQQYLYGLDVPPNLFETSVPDCFVYAYIALLETLTNWPQPLSGISAWLYLAAVILLFSSVWLAIKMAEVSPRLKRAELRLSQNRYAAFTGSLLMISAGTSTVLMQIPIILLSLIILPLAIGNYGAKQALQRDQAVYSRGCNQAVKAKTPCYAVKEGEKIIATGFLIATSPSRLAIYQNEKIQILPLKDYNIQTLIEHDHSPQLPGPR